MIKTIEKIDLLNCNDIDIVFERAVERLMLSYSLDGYILHGDSRNRIKVVKVLSLLTGLPIITIEASIIDPETFSMPVLENQGNQTHEKIYKCGLPSKGDWSEIVKDNTFKKYTEEDLIKRVAEVRALRSPYANLRKLINKYRDDIVSIVFIDDYYDCRSDIIRRRLWEVLELKIPDIHFIVGSDTLKPAQGEFFSSMEIEATGIR